MLWNTIYEFYVKYIFGGYWFGGTPSNPELFQAQIGRFLNDDGTYPRLNTATLVFNFNGVSLSLGNYLSLLATIITLIVILVFCCLLIKKFYNMVAHVIG